MKTIISIALLIGSVTCISEGDISLVPNLNNVQHSAKDLSAEIKELVAEIRSEIQKAEKDLDGDIKHFLVKVNKILAKTESKDANIDAILYEIEELVEQTGKNVEKHARDFADDVGYIADDGVMKIKKSSKKAVTDVEETVEKARKGLGNKD